MKSQNILEFFQPELGNTSEPIAKNLCDQLQKLTTTQLTHFYTTMLQIAECYTKPEQYGAVISINDNDSSCTVIGINASGSQVVDIFGIFNSSVDVSGILTEKTILN